MGSAVVLLRNRRRWVWIGCALAVVVSVSTLLFLLSGHSEQKGHSLPPEASEAPGTNSPPWVYGRSDARFTIIEYADLLCEYCRAYFPTLRLWIDQNPQVKLQWHHLPLSMHEPAATNAARLAECAGRTAGNSSFWAAIAWVYANPNDANGFREPPPQFPISSPALIDCLGGPTPDAVIRAQTQEAAQDGIMATPTLRLIDNLTGRDLILSGPVEGDALLSAVDLLLGPPADEQASADQGP